jgi:hypothetical protein
MPLEEGGRVRQVGILSDRGQCMSTRPLGGQEYWKCEDKVYVMTQKKEVLVSSLCQFTFDIAALPKFSIPVELVYGIM